MTRVLALAPEYGSARAYGPYIRQPAQDPYEAAVDFFYNLIRRDNEGKRLVYRKVVTPSDRGETPQYRIIPNPLRKLAPPTQASQPPSSVVPSATPPEPPAAPAVANEQGKLPPFEVRTYRPEGWWANLVDWMYNQFYSGNEKEGTIQPIIIYNLEGASPEERLRARMEVLKKDIERGYVTPEEVKSREMESMTAEAAARGSANQDDATSQRNVKIAALSGPPPTEEIQERLQAIYRSNPRYWSNTDMGLPEPEVLRRIMGINRGLAREARRHGVLYRGIDPASFFPVANDDVAFAQEAERTLSPPLAGKLLNQQFYRDYANRLFEHELNRAIIDYQKAIEQEALRAEANRLRAEADYQTAIDREIARALGLQSARASAQTAASDAAQQRLQAQRLASEDNRYKTRLDAITSALELATLDKASAETPEEKAEADHRIRLFYDMLMEAIQPQPGADLTSLHESVKGLVNLYRTLGDGVIADELEKFLAAPENLNLEALSEVLRQAVVDLNQRKLAALEDSNAEPAPPAAPPPEPAANNNNNGGSKENQSAKASQNRGSDFPLWPILFY